MTSLEDLDSIKTELKFVRQSSFFSTTYYAVKERCIFYYRAGNQKQKNQKKLKDYNRSPKKRSKLISIGINE